jgi:hypothetical protein
VSPDVILRLPHSRRLLWERQALRMAREEREAASV